MLGFSNHLTTSINGTQHNDIPHNDTQHNVIQHNDPQHNDIQHNDTRQNDIQCSNYKFVKTLSKTALLADSDYCYAKCRYAECSGVIKTVVSLSGH